MVDQTIEFNKFELLRAFIFLMAGLAGLFHISVNGIFDNYGAITDSLHLFIYVTIAVAITFIILIETIEMIFVKSKRSWIMFVHHALAIYSNIIALLSLDLKFGVIMYITELSTPFLILRTKMREKCIEDYRSTIVSLLFAAMFIITRLIIMPISAIHNLFVNIPYYMYYETVSATHGFITFVSIVLLAMNIYWGRIVIKGLMEFFFS